MLEALILIMPLSMKIQPIDAGSEDHSRSEMVVPVGKPVVKSRLRRLFRISVAEKEAEPFSGEVFEPSSVCLAKMVQNFIEETTEKPPSGRNRCNCFNGSGSDGSSDGESDAVGVCDFLKVSKPINCLLSWKLRTIN